MDTSLSMCKSDDRFRIRRFSPYIVLLGISFSFWLIALSILNSRSSPIRHNPFDQHTRQAESWIHGRMSLDHVPSYLEIASFEGHLFNSFPPTPSLVEFPLVLLFGNETPSYVVLYLFCVMALFSLYGLGVMMGLRKTQAILLSLCFIFGTNVLSSMTTAGVWAQGQIYGFCLAILGLKLILSRPVFAYLTLSLAVGCRPFYVFYLPLLLVLDRRWGERKFAQVFRTATMSFSPYIIAMALYNWVRFHSPIEFGHAYLPWSQKLKNGIFSLSYLPSNFFHTFFNLPTLGWKAHLLEFHGRGTAFALNNPVVALGIAGLSSPFLKKEIRYAAIFALLLVWFCLLLHESNGWFQFGLRYSIDIAPIAVLGAIAACRSFSRDGVIVVLTVFSIWINCYGLQWLASQ